ncbi:MAG: integration host factor subunit alpha [Bdellovibrionota bacterium]
MTLTKDRIIEIMKNKSQISSQDAKQLVETVIESIKNKLEEGEEVKISGFGKWIVREKKSRPGRNPHTGQKIEITARKVVTFHPSEKFREEINNANLDDSKLVMVGEHENEHDEDVSA